MHNYMYKYKSIIVGTTTTPPCGGMVALGIRVERIIFHANPTYTIESARLRAMPE